MIYQKPDTMIGIVLDREPYHEHLLCELYEVLDLELEKQYTDLVSMCRGLILHEDEKCYPLN